MRTIKTLGIATAVALCLIAFVGAASASANNFKVGAEPATWSGSKNGSNHSLFVGETLSCSGVSFSAETKITSFKEITVTPELNCNFPGPFPAKVELNGCKYRFNAGPGTALSGTLDIVGCEKPMRLTNGGSFCEIEIGNQKGLGTVSYENVAGSPATLNATPNLNSITYTTRKCSSPTGTFQNGTYFGKLTIKAFASGGIQTSAEIESTLAAPFKIFTFEEAPAILSGTVTSEQVLNFPNNWTIYCGGTTYSGTSSTLTAETVTVTPTFHGCEGYSILGETPVIPDAYITAGGCSYQLQAKGGFAIVGASCESKPITITVPGCIITVGPQSGFAGPTFKNEGSGKLRKVRTTHNTATKGLAYTAVGAGCQKQGTFNEASPKVNAVLSAQISGGEVQGFSVE